jgi:hypothetical protein
VDQDTKVLGTGSVGQFIILIYIALGAILDFIIVFQDVDLWDLDQWFWLNFLSKLVILLGLYYGKVWGYIACGIYFIIHILYEIVVTDFSFIVTLNDPRSGYGFDWTRLFLVNIPIIIINLFLAVFIIYILNESRKGIGLSLIVDPINRLILIFTIGVIFLFDLMTIISISNEILIFFVLIIRLVLLKTLWEKSQSGLTFSKWFFSIQAFFAYFQLISVNNYFDVIKRIFHPILLILLPNDNFGVILILFLNILIVLYLILNKEEIINKKNENEDEKDQIINL